MKTLPKPIEQIGFVEREKDNGKSVKNKCGRDFLYYALNYYLPEKFNPQELSPTAIERKKLFGLHLPSGLMWTQLQFLKLPSFLRQNGLVLSINNRKIDSFISFFVAILFSRLYISDALQKVEEAVNKGKVSGIDIGLKFGGLLDHIIFVYGYDEEALYVLDTHKVPMLEYTKLTDDNRHFMKLPKEVIKKRWTRFGRVWEMEKL